MFCSLQIDTIQKFFVLSRQDIENMKEISIGHKIKMIKIILGNLQNNNQKVYMQSPTINSYINNQDIEDNSNNYLSIQQIIAKRPNKIKIKGILKKEGYQPAKAIYKKVRFDPSSNNILQSTKTYPKEKIQLINQTEQKVEIQQQQNEKKQKHNEMKEKIMKNKIFKSKQKKQKQQQKKQKKQDNISNIKEMKSQDNKQSKNILPYIYIPQKTYCYECFKEVKQSHQFKQKVFCSKSCLLLYKNAFYVIKFNQHICKICYEQIHSQQLFKVNEQFICLEHNQYINKLI